MISTFNCSETDCPNNGIDYNMEGEVAFAQCGGCGIRLEPITQPTE